MYNNDDKRTSFNREVNREVNHDVTIAVINKSNAVFQKIKEC